MTSAGLLIMDIHHRVVARFTGDAEYLPSTAQLPARDA
jgi:hypothetical protein